ncbi:hypothetical protein ACFYOB_26705, partial [Streptomyces sp. NPDC006463]
MKTRLLANATTATRTAAMTTAACLLVLNIASAGPANAHDGHGGHGSAPSTGGSAPAFTTPSSGRSVTLIARLSGGQEVPVDGGPAVDDPAGESVARVEVKGDRVGVSRRGEGRVRSR